MSSLEQEVRTLQKQVRRQRRWNLGLVALVVVGGLMAATAERSVPDVIQAKKFEVVNDEKDTMVSMSSSGRGGMIGLFGPGGDSLIGLLAGNKNGAEFTLSDSKGGSRFLMGCADDGRSMFMVNDKEEKRGPRVVIATRNGAGYVITFDKNESGQVK